MEWSSTGPSWPGLGKRNIPLPAPRSGLETLFLKSGF
jgi:hypothetical protein